MSSLAKIYQDGTYASKNATFGDDNAKLKISSALEACRNYGLAPQTLAEVGCGGGLFYWGSQNP
jgi:hypothetical protein